MFSSLLTVSYKDSFYSLLNLILCWTLAMLKNRKKTNSKVAENWSSRKRNTWLVLPFLSLCDVTRGVPTELRVFRTHFFESYSKP